MTSHNNREKAASGLSCLTCVWAALTAGTLAFAFEASYRFVLPSLSEWQEIIATVLFAACASALGCRVAVRMSRRMHNRLRREICARKEAEQLFRAIAVATNAGIWNWDVADDLTWFNPEFVEAWGYCLEDALAHDFWRARVHPEDRDLIVDSLLAAVRRQDSTWSGEYRFQRADGSYAYVLDRGTIFRDERGRAVRVCGGMIDLTERKTAQAQQVEALQALQASETAFRSLFENAPFGMYRSTTEGKLLAANPALVKMLGYESVEELQRLASGADIYVHREDRAAMVKRLLQEKSITGLELQWKRKDGNPIVVRFSGRVCSDGDRDYFECTAEDITQHHELQQELQQSQKMEAIGQLAGGVAHDFNNMLLVILMSAQLLQNEFAPGDRRRKRIDEIIHACDRASAFTQQLLAFGRRQMRAPQIVNLNAVAADAMRMIQRLIGESIELTLLAARVPCSAHVDPSQMVQVIMNLCINARDAMPMGGTLTVSTDVRTFTEKTAPPGLNPGTYSVLSVQDTGTGMNEEIREHLFEPFFTTKQKGKHSGLGLATVYGIVRQSGGRVLVESEVGEGSTFRMMLPYEKPAAIPREPEDSSSKAQTITGATVLVVEDETPLREAIGDFLESSGYVVLKAENGEHAMAVAADRIQHVDLLLTDVVMPKMGGSELAQRLSALNPALKIIFMSGYSDDVALRDSILTGTAFMQKPFQLAALSKKLGELLAGSTHETPPLTPGRSDAMIPAQSGR
jgi:two-component system, cell cycle sensor histidine kinase and response regulator CckA